MAMSTVPRSVSPMERPETIWKIAPEIMAPAIAPSRAPTIPAQKRSGTKTVKCQSAMPIVNQTTAAISSGTPGRDFVAADAGQAGDGRNCLCSSMSPVLAPTALLAAALRALSSLRLGAIALRGRAGWLLRPGSGTVAPVPVDRLGLGLRLRFLDHRSRGCRRLGCRCRRGGRSGRFGLCFRVAELRHHVFLREGGQVAHLVDQPLAPRPVCGLALLPVCEHRCRDEDRRIC